MRDVAPRLRPCALTAALSPAPQALFCATFALSVFLLLLIVFDMTEALTPGCARFAFPPVVPRPPRRTAAPNRSGRDCAPLTRRYALRFSALQVAWRLALFTLLAAIMVATPFYLFYIALSADGAPLCGVHRPRAERTAECAAAAAEGPACAR